jgi:hypothetical protein
MFVIEVRSCSGTWVEVDRCIGRLEAEHAVRLNYPDELENNQRAGSDSFVRIVDEDQEDRDEPRRSWR